MIPGRSDNHALSARLEAVLLGALPPLFQKVRAPAVSALAIRALGHWRPGADAAPAHLIAALRASIAALQADLARVEAETQAFSRAYQEAEDDDARRAVLVAQIQKSAPNRREKWKDLRALKRWMGFDALKERLDRERQVLLVQEELALRCIKGLATSRVRAELKDTAAACLDRGLHAARPQNQVAAFDALAALLKVSPEALSERTGALDEVGLLLRRPDTGVWLAAAAFEALLHASPARALGLLKDRVDQPPSGARDFMFRRRAVETIAEFAPADVALQLFDHVARSDQSEYVRMAVCDALATLPPATALHRHLAGLGEQPEQSAKVRASAVITAVKRIAQRKEGWPACAELLCDVVERDEDALVLRVACDLLAQEAEALCDDEVAAVRARLGAALSALRQRPGLTGPVLESAAAAAEAVARASDDTRRGWTRFLREALSNVRPGGRTRVRVDPPPAGLPPLPEDEVWLGAVLAELSRDDFGVYARRRGATLELRRGERFERRSWRMLHEAARPAPNKRQGFVHTVGRAYGGELRAHPAHMDEITATMVPGERVHISQEGTWGRHLPTVDDLLELPLAGEGVRLFSSHGVTTVTPPSSLSRRIKNRVVLTTKYDKLAALRLNALRGQEPRERRRYVEALQQDLGVEVTFSPYRAEECPPPRIASLFGAPGKNTALHAAGLVEGTVLAQAMDVLLEKNEYFFGMRGNGVMALATFTAALFTFFMVDAWRKRESVRRARAQLPLCIGGWGTRGKSGTERLKAALFNGLGFEVFAKTTGSEAMFVHTAPSGVPSEFFIFRPYDKATIWEQRDMAALAARLGTEVFLWECMALQPDFVELLQNDWMRDDYATLTNAYPDHEDIQGPAGMNVAQVITRFMPEGRTVVTTEDHFLPLFRQAAKDKGTQLVHSAWWEAELIPDELLAQFPYAEHPRNMALVATLAEQLGVPRTTALGLMAEHVQPEIGVLKVFPKVRVRGRTLSFINGHSANERTGFLNNWVRTGLDKVDPDASPERAVVTVINNRWDRVARSEVFARIAVEDAPADRHVLIGTNLEGLQKYMRDALDEHTSRIELATAEDLNDAAGPIRALERLRHQLTRLKVPAADLATFIDRLQRYAFGAGLDVVVGADLTRAVEAALASDGDCHVGHVRKELEKTIRTHLEHALRPLAETDDEETPEVIAPATRDEVCAHALYLLARQVVSARLQRQLPADASELKAFHQTFRTAYRELFLEQVVPVPDAHATGDQIIDTVAKSVPPGLDVSIMGAQNIKGTGLDWVYRWMAVDKVTSALRALKTGTRDERRRALELLEAFADNGVADAAAGAHHLPKLAEGAQDADEAQRLTALAQRYRALHEAKLAALTTAKEGSRAERFVRGIETVFDYLDSVRRRKVAEQLVDDLVNFRVSHARAAIETRRLYERQKGGWLWKGLTAKKAKELPPPHPPALPPVHPQPLDAATSSAPPRVGAENEVRQEQEPH